jgi:hypothetical protein
MRPPNSLTDEELVTYSHDHIRYEIGMLQWTAAILLSLPDLDSTGVFAETIKNSLLNSFASHARNLIDFLYLRNHFGRDKSGDIVVEDYIESTFLDEHLPPITKTLEDAKVKANKQVAHLTVERLAYEVAGKEWQFMQIYMQIMKAFLSISAGFPREKTSDTFRTLISHKQVDFPDIKASEIIESGHPVGFMVKGTIKE